MTPDERAAVDDGMNQEARERRCNVTAIEKAWEKHESGLGNRIGAKARASIKATYMAGYYDAVNAAASAARDLAEDSFAPMSAASRAEHWAKVSAKAKSKDD